LAQIRHKTFVYCHKNNASITYRNGGKLLQKGMNSHLPNVKDTAKMFTARIPGILRTENFQIFKHPKAKSLVDVIKIIH